MWLYPQFVLAIVTLERAPSRIKHLEQIGPIFSSCLVLVYYYFLSVFLLQETIILRFPSCENNFVRSEKWMKILFHSSFECTVPGTRSYDRVK